MGFWNYAKTGLNLLVPPTALYGPTQSDAAKSALSDPGADDERRRKDLLYGQAASAGQFADRGQQAWGGYQMAGLNSLAGLQRQASGQDSVSAMQLRQGLQQALAQQRSLAAGAAPQDAGGAARTAAIQSGRLAAGMSGQQALAGIQERHQAAQDAAGLIGTLGGQAANIALGSRQTATQGYGAGNAGEKEKSNLEKYGPLITDAAGAAAKASSDRRGKTDIQPGDAAANRSIDQLSAMMFRYKNPNTANPSNVAGSAPRLGVMAQDLERAGLGHTVKDTPAGKQVLGADLAATNTGMIAALGRRVKELEAAGRPVPREEGRMAEDLLYKSAQSPGDARAMARPLMMARQRIAAPYTPSDPDAERWLYEYANGGRR